MHMLGDRPADGAFRSSHEQSTEGQCEIGFFVSASFSPVTGGTNSTITPKHYFPALVPVVARLSTVSIFFIVIRRDSK